jgi:F0F1-type ATP synthase membrane subunit b/b'
MKEGRRSTGWLWLALIIFAIYHFNVVSNLENKYDKDIAMWEDDYNEAETMLKQALEEKEDVENELQEIRDCFTDESVSYCLYNYF